VQGCKKKQGKKQWDDMILDGSVSQRQGKERKSSKVGVSWDTGKMWGHFLVRIVVLNFIFWRGQ